VEAVFIVYVCSGCLIRRIVKDTVATADVFDIK
jgi:hypothetical protein